MALSPLQGPLKYGGNGPIASPSKAQQVVVHNSRRMQSAFKSCSTAFLADFDP